MRAFSAPRDPGSPVDPRAWALKLEPGRQSAPSPDARDATGRDFPIVATSERDVPGQRPARIVVVCDADAFRDEQILTGHLPNLDLAIGLFQWSTDREGLVSVSSATVP